MPIIDATPFVGVLKAISANSATNNFLPIPSGAKRVLIRRITATNASATLAAATTTLGVSTLTAAGGTIIVTAATGVLTPLTGSTITQDATIAATAAAVLLTPPIPTGNNPQTGVPYNTGGIFITTAGTPNVAATFDVYVEAQFYD